jgi:hypothetical protein
MIKMLTSNPSIEVPTIIADLMVKIGHEDVRLVGGSVRDSLLGLEVKDWDLATRLHPEACVKRLKAYGLTPLTMAIAHGTVRVIYHGLDIQITSLREDIQTDGRRAIVVFGAEWVKDAQRRDFSINALYADMNGAIEDPLDQGLSDLSLQKVVFIGEPRARIKEDYLRILRFFRFSARFANTIDPQGLKACEEMAAGLCHLSNERVQKEILMILNGPKATEILLMMQEVNLFEAMTQRALSQQTIKSLKSPGIYPLWEKLVGEEGVAKLSFLSGRDFPLTQEDCHWLTKTFRLSRAQSSHLKSLHNPHLWSELTKLELMTGQVDIGKCARGLVYYHGWQVLSEAFYLKCLMTRSNPDFEKILVTLKSWPVPKFNIDSKAFAKERKLEGRALGEALKIAEDAWVQSDFEFLYL